MQDNVKVVAENKISRKVSHLANALSHMRNFFIF